MTKRFFSLMLALCMVGSIIVTVHVSAETTNSGTCGENLTWMLDDGTLTISGSGDMYDYIYPDMPWYSSLSDINNVIIGNGVTSIGDYAFNACRSLESVAIADSVKNIGDYAFYLCNKLSDVYYIGTTEEWDKIVIEGHNTPLTVANIHYNYLPPSEIVYNTESNTIELSPFNVISGKVIVATYNGNILLDISIYEAEHKINGITIDKTNATTAKIFWLDSLKKLDPKCDALEISL